MKHYFYTLLAFCLFATSVAFAQNGTHKLRTGYANYEYYPVSLMLYGGDSTTYTYDNMGRYSEERHWYWDAQNGLRLAGRTTDYVYTASGNLLSLIKQSYNNTTGWKTYERNNYTYDLSENLLTVLYENFDSSAGWVNDLRIERSYDSAGNTLSSIVENWNGTAWVLNNGLYFTYDTGGHVLTRTTNDQYRITYTYDGEGNPLSELSTHYEFGLWQADSRTLYLYSIQPGLPPIERWNQLWNGLIFKTYSRQTYSYNTTGDVTSSLYQYSNNSGWTNSDRYTYQYNDQRQETFFNYEEWKNSAWAKHTRYYYTYDDDYDLKNSRKEQWNNAWYSIGSARYYYQNSTPVQTPLLADFELFPNPANTSVTLKGEDLWRSEIFDLQGHIVASFNAFGQVEKTIQVGHLPVGKYFLRVSNQYGEIRTKPLMIAR